MKTRLEVTIEADMSRPTEELPAAILQLREQLHPMQWALLERVALAVCNLSAVDEGTRRVMLKLGN